MKRRSRYAPDTGKRWCIIRRGITRTVILTPRYAIKLPSLRAHGDGLAGLLWSLCRGILASQSEIEWHSYKDQEKVLCPVLWHGLGGMILVMPRCAPLPVDSEGEYDGELPVLNPNPGDNKPENYGLLDGRIVRTDYDMSFNACPHERGGALNRLHYPVSSS